MRWITFFAMLLASPALSLSCSAPDPVEDFKQVNASPVLWNVVLGKLTFSENALPKVDMNRPEAVPEKTAIRARLTGQSLNTDGFRTAYDRTVTLEVDCLLTWCGGAQSGQSFLAFVKHDGNKRIVFARPCGGMLYANPSAKVLNRVTTCFAGGPCR